MVRAGQIHCEHACPGLGRRLGHITGEVAHSRDVGNPFQAAELTSGLRHHPLDCRQLGDVGVKPERPAAGVSNRLDRRGEAVSIDVDTGDRAPLGGQPKRGRPPDTRCCASHEQAAALKASCPQCVTRLR